MNIHLPAILMFTRGTRVLTYCHIASNLWVVIWVLTIRFRSQRWPQNDSTLPGLVNVYKKLMGKSPCSMGKSTISMVIFNSELLNDQRVPQTVPIFQWKTRGYFTALQVFGRKLQRIPINCCPTKVSGYVIYTCCFDSRFCMSWTFW